MWFLRVESKSRLDAIYMRRTKEISVTKISISNVNSDYWHLSNTELLKRDKNVDQQVFDLTETHPFLEGQNLPLFASDLVIMTLSVLY